MTAVTRDEDLIGEGIPTGRVLAVKRGVFLTQETEINRGRRCLALCAVSAIVPVRFRFARLAIGRFFAMTVLAINEGHRRAATRKRRERSNRRMTAIRKEMLLPRVASLKEILLLPRLFPNRLLKTSALMR